MPIFSPKPNCYINIIENEQTIKVLKKEDFDSFNSSVLGLGDITQASNSKPAIAAVFDLEGFTNFCKQIEPQLSVPIFLKQFLDWIFGEIRKETCKKEFAEGYQLWHPLPFFTKFMGDGLLVLWDCSSIHSVNQHNLITTLDEIAGHYAQQFLPEMKKKVCDVPSALRCGIAKGTVYSVGDGNDFVGPCINLAARLQKLDGIKFAFARRGFSPEDQWKEDQLEYWTLKEASIRGMGEKELIYIRKSEFENLSKIDSRKYHDP